MKNFILSSIVTLFLINLPSIPAYGTKGKTGMGYCVLKEGVKIGNQINKSNTIYVVKNDFILDKTSIITIPQNCVLEFEGGSINGGTIIGNNTIIKASPLKIFSLTTELVGSWNVGYWYPEWFGAIGDGVTDDTEALQKLNGKSILLSNKIYLCSNLKFNSYTCLLGINKFNSCLKQQDDASGDFIRMEDWFGGTISDIRIEGGRNVQQDSSLWMQALLKIVNYTYKHNPIAPGGYDGQDVSTYYSSINNVVIRNSCYSGLSVLGFGNTDAGKAVEHNWIHKITNVWVEQCSEYGIYDCATDNQWANINVSRCGYTNLYIAGASELFNNVKLDGESGYRLDGQDSYEILRNRYDGSGLVLIGGNNTITGLDIQSMKYKGITLDASMNTIIGSINNCGLGFRNSAKDQRNCPAVYLYGQNVTESNTLILNVYSVSDIVGTCVIKDSPDKSKVINNNLNIQYRPNNGNYKSESYKLYVKDLKGFNTKDNNVIIPNIEK